MTFRVFGIPAPQGSKRHVGRGIMIESSSKVKPWRESVKGAAIEDGQMFERDQALAISIDFIFKRPPSVSQKKRPNHIVTPDLDKLVRSTMDALTQAGTWADDSQVVWLQASKQYSSSPAERPGAWIQIVQSLDGHLESKLRSA